MPINVRVPIEVDVTYVNKAWYSPRKKANPKENHYVIGFYQRPISNVTCQAIIKAIPNNNPETIESIVLETITKGATLYANEKILPISLSEFYDIHDLKVSEREFMRGNIHINNVNNMWASLKRLIKREHVQVSQKHLQLYCSEVAWRINKAHLTPKERFEDLFSGMEAGSKHKTFKELTK